MSHPDPTPDAADFRFAGDLAPDDPFTSLNFHFGMLLGVDDFETEQAYHRGGQRLHQAWLHGPGVVWGLAVALDQEDDEVRVERGLALDAAGRWLHLDGPACLDPGAWYDKHADEVEPIEPPPAGADVAFDAHVEIAWTRCLTRPVPALAEPCQDAGTESAYSRAWETVELRVLPGLAEPPADRYRRIRILLGLLAPGASAADQEAAAARAAVLAVPQDGRTTAGLERFRALAGADAIDLQPEEPEDAPRPLTPVAPPAPLVLANLRGVALRRNADGGYELVGGTVELLPRRSHVASETVQELAVAALTDAAGAGPRITGVTLSGTDVELALSAPLDARSVQPAAFTVTELAAGGWQDVAVTAAASDDAAPKVTLTLASAPTAPWRLLARGTGPAPLVDADLNALGGDRDFKHFERS